MSSKMLTQVEKFGENEDNVANFDIAGNTNIQRTEQKSEPGTMFLLLPIVI